MPFNIKIWLFIRIATELSNLNTITISTYMWRFYNCQIFAHLHWFVYKLYRSNATHGTVDVMLMIWFWWQRSTLVTKYCKSYVSFQDVKVPCDNRSTLWDMYWNLKKKKWKLWEVKLSMYTKIEINHQILIWNIQITDTTEFEIT